MAEQNTTNEIMANVASSLIKDSIKSAWGKVKKYFKDIDAKDQIKFGDAYDEYLNNTESQYSKIKTIIYRHVPKDLYSFYECVGVKYNGITIDTSTITNLLDVNNRIIITGTGGIGKTIMLKHFFLNTVKETDYIPVLIELRRFNSAEGKNINLKDGIQNVLHQNGFSLEKEYYDYSLQEGGYVILLDGFDEVSRDNANDLARQILDFSCQYPQNKFILTSRPSEEFIGWSTFSEMTACPLSKDQALSLIRKLDFDQTTKEKFYTELDKSLYEKYTSFAANPLLLNIMLLTFDKNAAIPDKLNDFYEQAFATLFNMHDATKDAYVRDILSGLGSEDFKTVFAYICFKSYFSYQYEFSEPSIREYIQKAKEKFSQLRFSVDDFLEDLTTSVCMLVKEGLNYRFSHRSFQEYFAAWYTCKLTDDIQKKLLTNWIKESPSVSHDSYFTMLFNLQGERVNKTVFAPILKQVKKEYDSIGFTLPFLERISEGVNVIEEKHLVQEGLYETDYRTSIRIKDMLKCTVLIYTCRLNGYPYPQSESDEAKRIYEVLFKQGKKRRGCIPFREAAKLVGEEQLLESLEWLKNQLLYAFSILEKVEKNSVGNKKRVSSILDEI